MRFELLLVLLGILSGANAQNIGIGTNTPLTPLDLRSTLSNHVLRIDGTEATYISINENGTYRGYLGSFSGNPEDIDLGTGIGNATGKLHLAIAGVPKLTIRENGHVGINLTTPESPLDVNGNLNVRGRLTVNGDGGQTGQLLVSNGTNAPTWQTVRSAFENDVRFEATFTSSTGLASATYTSVINTNTSAINITGSSITINQTGLYHIEGYYQSSTRFNTEPTYFGHSFGLAFGSRSYVQSTTLPFAKDPSISPQASYLKLVPFSQEVYITAPTTINLLRTDNYPLAFTPLSFTHNGRISGYLIAN